MGRCMSIGSLDVLGVAAPSSASRVQDRRQATRGLAVAVLHPAGRKCRHIDSSVSCARSRSTASSSERRSTSS